VNGAAADAKVRAIIDRSELGVLVRQLQGALDGKAVKCGLATVTFPGGSRYSGVTLVDHGLGATPVAALAGPYQAAFYLGGVSSTSATQIGLQITTADGSSPAAATAVTVAWLAIG
jgi:hypothetical protein